MLPKLKLVNRDVVYSFSHTDSTWNLSLGYSANLMCTTIIPVDEIKWLDSNGEIVASKFDTDELSLTFNPVNASIHNKQFTCTAKRNGSVNKTVILSVGGEQDESK